MNYLKDKRTQDSIYIGSPEERWKVVLMRALIDEDSLFIFTAILSTKYLNWRGQNNEGLLQAAAIVS